MALSPVGSCEDSLSERVSKSPPHIVLTPALLPEPTALRPHPLPLALDGPLDRVLNAAVGVGDDPATVGAKRGFAGALVLAWVMLAIALVVQAAAFPSRTYSIVSCAVGVVGYACVYGYMCATKHVGGAVQGAFAAVSALVLIPIDLEAAAGGGERAWAGVAPVLFVLAASRASRALLVGVAAAFAGWLVLIEIEFMTRMGLFDTPGLPGIADRTAVMLCEAPPCAQKAPRGLGACVAVVTVLAALWFSRRGKFGGGEDGCEALGQVLRLVALDTHGAAELLDSLSSALPPVTRAALRDLIDDVGHFRPFVPDSVKTAMVSSTARDICPTSPDNSSFGRSDPAENSASTPEDVPGMETETAAIVFTDIVGSTKLWDACPDGMDAAVLMHETLIRQQIAAFHGYEVKTIGDAFMVAFPEFTHAIDFGVSVLHIFRRAVWPEAMADVPGFDVSNGLQLRIGAAAGGLKIRKNDLTGRYDYFGPVVNKAARLESHGSVGFVSVDADEISFSLRRGLEDRQIGQRRVGPVMMPGIPNPVTVTALAYESDLDRQRPALIAVRRVPGAVTPDPATLQAAPLKSTSKLHLGLQKQARACVVRALHVLHYEALAEEEVSSLLKTLFANAISSAARCHGAMINADGSSLTYGWGFGHGARSRSTDRYMDSLRFCTLLRRTCSAHDTNDRSDVTSRFGDEKAQMGESIPSTSAASVLIRFGIASGSVYHGYLGTSTARTVAAAGRTIDIASELARCARDMNTNSLVGSVGGAGYAWHPVLEQCLQPISLQHLLAIFGDVAIHVLDEAEAVRIWQDKVRQNAGETTSRGSRSTPPTSTLSCDTPSMLASLPTPNSRATHLHLFPPRQLHTEGHLPRQSSDHSLAHTRHVSEYGVNSFERNSSEATISLPTPRSMRSGSTQVSAWTPRTSRTGHTVSTKGSSAHADVVALM
eukprot:TRINITY_DN3490_c1_g4_i1.p1 TRINITY_DN3490_c1_g4~~TRINITY_DN3490_c1_g4_i1.p1  ORF type:complete len:939 (+),score=119.14 TRINITY_DN3490_c1_g4_i1:54-2870(+)